jgi:hypothetical protein
VSRRHAPRRDNRTAVEIAADRTAAKISVLLCKTPCCLVDETGASIWTSSVVTFTAVGFMAVVCKECRCRACFCTGGRTCYCSVTAVRCHSLPNLFEVLLRVTCDRPSVRVAAGVCVNEHGPSSI